MSKKCTILFRSLFLFVSLVSLVILSACDHHHHSNNTNPILGSSVTLSIDASDFNLNSSIRKQTNGDSDFAVSTTGYDNGQSITTLNDVKPTLNGNKYVCKISGLFKVYDYRFSVKYKGKIVLENQISKSELENDAEVPVDVNTSVKTLAYKSWLSKNPSNKSFRNFLDNCLNQGIEKSEDFGVFYDTAIYKEKLGQIAKGEDISVPSIDDIKTEEIDKISTNDAEKESTAILGTWYLYSEDDLPVAATDNGDVITITFNSDKTYTWENYDMEGCPDSGKPEYYQTGELESKDKGTWKYSDGKLTIKYDELESSFSLKVENDSFVITFTDDETGETTTSVYKKTKNSFKPTTEKALEGDWFLNIEDDFPVVPNRNGKVDTLTLNSDGTFLLFSYDEELVNYSDKDEPEYWQTKELDLEATGTWKYNNGSLILKTEGEEIIGDVKISNGVLTLSGTDEETSQKYVSVYKKLPGSYRPAIVKALLGTWYLNEEDGENVVPNANNEVETWTFNDDETFVSNSYDLESDNTDYWQTGDICKTINGFWSYDKGSVTITTYNEEETGEQTVEEMVISISIKDDVLTAIEVDEDSEESKSIFKRTKPSAK